MNHSSADQSNRNEIKETETDETEKSRQKVLPISHYHSIKSEREESIGKLRE
jgi:hypothetical protein